MTTAQAALAMAFAQAQDAAPEAAPPASPFSGMLLMFLVFGLIMYVFMIRPSQRREKERRLMLAGITKGDRVVTNGGIYGTVVGLSEKSVVLRVDDDSNVKIEFLRGAISQVVSRGDKE